jgi:hypothetical protein
MNAWLWVVVLGLAAWAAHWGADQLLTPLKMLFRPSGRYSTASKLPDLFIRTIALINVNLGAGRIFETGAEMPQTRIEWIKKEEFLEFGYLNCLHRSPYPFGVKQKKSVLIIIIIFYKISELYICPYLDLV